MRPSIWDMAARSLAQETVHRMDIVGRTDATLVGDAVVVVFLPKGGTAGGVVHFDDEAVVRRAWFTFAGHAG